MIVVTGATGQLGRLVVEELLQRVPAGQIVAAVRSPEKAADLAAKGVDVRRADYDEPASLALAFAGADRVLLISGSEVGRRLPQHKAVVDAAQQAGVGLLAYTSVLNADTSPLGLAPEHLGTEGHIRESGVPFTFLRNGWYTENYEAAVHQGVEHGFLIGSAGTGRVASATRGDFAAATAAVLTGEGHEGKIYELSGDVAWSFSELAEAISRIAGKEVVYRDVPPEEHRRALTGAGLPEPVVEMLVDVDRCIAEGALAGTPGDLKTLSGRPTTPLAETLAQVLRD
ncbi:MAG: family NAD(P)-dependent oxidoreductase [Streptosporangiaceae bacterium]|nr:family NAD(P)-dependent oxidoreductase [Streptosporangiaceae bacterium]